MRGGCFTGWGDVLTIEYSLNLGEVLQGVEMW